MQMSGVTVGISFFDVFLMFFFFFFDVFFDVFFFFFDISMCLGICGCVR
jgi:hypothetical protein